MRHFQNSAPDSFSDVLLPNNVNREDPARHDRYYDNETRTTGRIEGIIEALSPIHIGSGIMDFDQDIGATQNIAQLQNIEIIKTVVRKGGIAVVPGSSLKGAIRSVVEAISESCVCKTKKGIENILRELARDFVECRKRPRERTQLCVACRMFGAMGFQGHVEIQDAPQINGKIITKPVPELHSPVYYAADKEGVPLRKFYKHETLVSGNTLVEACEIGSKFRFVVQVNNLTQAEWGLLFTAFGHHPDHPFKLKIGGAKPVGFGSIDLQIEKIYIDGKIRDRYLDWDSQQGTAKIDQELKDWKTECIKAANSLIVPDLLEDLAQILQYPRETPQQSPTQTLQLQPQPPKEPEKPKVEVGDKVNATVLKKTWVDVTLQLHTDKNEEIVFDKPYFQGNVGEEVTLTVKGVDGEGKITRVEL